MKITVKFCGHCAPRMDMGELLTRLQEECAGEPGGLEFVYYMNDQQADILLILNACQAACASVDHFDGKVILVSPGQIDHWPVPEGSMCDVLRKKIIENS